MLDHKVPSDIIKQVGINWLKHFEEDASPARYKAIVSDFNYCVDHTVKELAENKDHKYNLRSPEEYLELESALIIPFNLHRLLNFLQSSNQCSNYTTDSAVVWPMSILLRGLTSPQQGIELINQKLKVKEIKQYQKIEEIKHNQKVDYNEKLLDTLIVICTVEYSKPKYKGNLVFTYKQVLDIMNVRWGGAPNEQRFCRDYVTRFAVLDDNKPDYPIIQRITMGVIVYSSTYKLTPVCKCVICDTAKANEGLLSAFFSPYVARPPEIAPLPEYKQKKPARAKRSATARKQRPTALDKQTARALAVQVELLSLVDTDPETVDSLVRGAEEAARSGEL